MAQLKHETEVFAAKIQKRAVDKKAEMAAEEEEEGRELTRFPSGQRKTEVLPA